jgi:hypothetical protein
MKTIVTLCMLFVGNLVTYGQPSIFDDDKTNSNQAQQGRKSPATRPSTKAKIPPPFEGTEEHKSLSTALAQFRRGVLDARVACETRVRSTSEYKGAERAMYDAKAKLDRVRETGTPQDRLDASALYVASKQQVEKLMTNALNSDRVIADTTREVTRLESEIATQKTIHEAWRLREVERQIPEEVRSYFAVIDAENRRRETDLKKNLEALSKEREVALAKLRRAQAMDTRRAPGFGITDVGGTDPNRAAARQSAINSANHEIQVVEEKLKRLDESVSKEVAGMELDLEVGAIGVIGNATAIQVVDSTNLIVSYRNKLLWITKHPTKGVVDDSILPLPGMWKITSTKRYNTAIGGSKTVFMAEPFSEPFIEYRPLIEFLRAARESEQKPENLKK